MQQFWFTVKKLKKTPFYEFGLDDKKFTVDVEVFREIFDICSRVLNEDFVAPPSEEDLLAFLIELGFKGLWIILLGCLFITCINHGEPWKQSLTNVYLGKLQAMADYVNQELLSCRVRVVEKYGRLHEDLKLKRKITQAECFPIPVHCFGHNSVIRTPFDTSLAATRREFNYLQPLKRPNAEIT
ncbi:hypothetical protein Tco_1533828 [Tanacetum coccineum]